MFGWSVIRITGNSMRPEFQCGDFAIFRRRKYYKIGEIVLAQHPKYGLIVKQITAKTEDGFLLKGLDGASVSTEQLGIMSPEKIKGYFIVKIGRRNKRI